MDRPWSHLAPRHDALGLALERGGADAGWVVDRGDFDPLTPDRYWILGAWFPFWVLNILGEEFSGGGVVLPRQEVALGRWAWLANGIGWLLFHLAFGPAILLTASG